MKYVVSKFNDDGSIYPVYECEDEEEAMKTAYACNGVYEKVSPSLTDDQQVVLEWLKWKQQEGSQPIECLYTLAFGDAIESVIIAYINLTESEQFQVLAAFAEWGLSNL